MIMHVNLLNNKRIGFLFFSFFVLSLLMADDEIYGGFYLGYDTSDTLKELLDIEATLGYIIDLPDKMEVKIEFESDSYEVNPNELTFKAKIGEALKLRAGYDKNHLTLSEDLSGFRQNPIEDGLLSDYYSFQGYVSRGVMLKLYTKEQEDILPEPLSWWLTLAKPYVNSDPQIEGGFYYHFLGEDSYLGFSGLYLPYFVYSFFFEDTIETQNYFACTLSVADLANPLIYRAELGFGKNKTSPLGIISLPTQSSLDYFLGMEAMVGLNKEFDRFTWQPCLEYSALMQDLSHGEYYQMELILGNQFYTSSQVKFFADLGFSWTEEYGISSDNNELELIGNIGIKIQSS